MKKSLIALALIGAFAAPAFAEEAAPAAAEAKGPHTITANAGLFSEYRFRGIGQTFGKPAIQGGFDYSHESGLYLGNWNSNVSETAGYPNGNIEMDFYGGWKWAITDDLGLDFGGLYYYYPGSNKSGISGSTYTYQVCNPNTGNCSNSDSPVTNGELYVGVNWKFLSFKWSHAVTEYFGMPDSRGSNYFDLSANYDLGDGWGINGHVGRLNVKHASLASYTDWKLGVTKDVGGFVFGLSYVDTNAKDGGDCGSGTGEFYHFCKASGSSNKDYRAGKAAAVLSVSRTF